MGNIALLRTSNYSSWKRSTIYTVYDLDLKKESVMYHNTYQNVNQPPEQKQLNYFRQFISNTITIL